MKRNTALFLSPADAAILRAFGRYHYLTARQVTRLHYAASSLTHVQEKLKRLTDAGYLRTNFRYREGRSGSSPYIYSLSLQGRRVLEKLGMEVTYRPTPSEQRAYKALFFDHTIAVNDVLIAVERLARQRNDVELLALKAERELKRLGSRVPLGSGEQVWVHLDGWFTLQFDESPWPTGLELDRGTEQQRRWRKKVTALLTWHRQVYPELFGMSALTIMVVIVPPDAVSRDKRLAELLYWTEQELTTLGQIREGQRFYFTTQNPSETDPEEFFFAPLWFCPFDKTPRPLLEVGDG